MSRIYLKSSKYILVYGMILFFAACGEIRQKNATINITNLDYTKIKCVFMIKRGIESDRKIIDQLRFLSEDEFFIVPVTDFNALPRPIIYDLIPSYEVCESTKDKIFRTFESLGKNSPVLIERNLLDYVDAFNGKNIFE